MRKLSVPWSVSADEVVQFLGSNSRSGLPSTEASKRLQEDGPNVLKVEKKVSSFVRLLNQFKSPVIIILIIASFITGILGEYTDSIAILVIVFINAVIGYFQEAKAEAAVEALKNLSAPRAKVLRDGIVKDVKASDICRGDVLVLEAGDYVPADARIVQASQLSAEEAVLTGESLPVNKFTQELPESSMLAERKKHAFC